jgi:hypothetical protein
MVIGVLLHKDGVHIIDVPVIGSVVVAGNHHADGKFFVLADAISIIEVFPFSIDEGIGSEERKILELQPLLCIGYLIHCNPRIVLVVDPVLAVLFLLNSI